MDIYFRVQLSAETGQSGCTQFTSPSPPSLPKVTKTVTLSLPSTHVPEAPAAGTMAPSPERKSNRQNVAIQVGELSLHILWKINYYLCAR